MVSPRRLAFRLCFLASAVLLAADARAAVNQPPPGNEPMPVATPQAEYSIWMARGFPMDAGTLAGLFKYHATTASPAATSRSIRCATRTRRRARFSPQCGLSGTIVLRGGGCKNPLGWYNATDDRGPPAANQIYQLVPSQSDDGAAGSCAWTTTSVRWPRASPPRLRNTRGKTRCPSSPATSASGARAGWAADWLRVIGAREPVPADQVLAGAS